MKKKQDNLEGELFRFKVENFSQIIFSANVLFTDELAAAEETNLKPSKETVTVIKEVKTNYEEAIKSIDIYLKRFK